MHARANEIVSVAKEVIDMRYRHHGRGDGTLDCVGLPIYIAKKLGLSNWDTTDYGPRPSLPQFNKLIRQTGAKRVPFSDLNHGDLVQISWDKASPVHVGIYEIDPSGLKWIIHAFKMHRKVTRDAITPKISDGFIAVWRFPD